MISNYYSTWHNLAYRVGSRRRPIIRYEATNAPPPAAPPSQTAAVTGRTRSE